MIKTLYTDKTVIVSPYDQLGRAINRHLRVAYTSFPPYSNKSPFGGLYIDLTAILSSHLKFTYTLSYSETHYAILDNVAFGQADLGLGLAILPSRMARLDFSTPVTLTVATFWTGYPKPVPSVWTIVNPFSRQVWQACLFSCLAALGCLIFINR